jgi:urease beta subunit
MRRLKVDVSTGETIRFEGEGKTLITLVAKSGQRTRFDIQIDDKVAIDLPEKATVQAIVGKGLKSLS